MAQALACAQPRKGQRAVDIGCGRGELSLSCARQGALVWGLDYAPAALELAQKLRGYARRNPHGLAFQQASALRLPLQSNSLDLAFMLDIVEHLHPQELEAALAEVQRVLKPAGRLIIHTMPNLNYYRFGYPIYRLVERLRGKRPPKNPRDRWGYAHLHVNEQTAPSLREALVQAGFQAQVWLEPRPADPQEDNPFVRKAKAWITRVPVLKRVFCNDIFAIGTKTGPTSE
jgi:ubiquinone/menaquinone biosynthesis C-methylase UbiE